MICIIIYLKFDYQKINLFMNLQKKNSNNIYWLENKTVENEFQNETSLEKRLSINSNLNTEDKKINSQRETNNETLKEKSWQLEIPKINLKANIAEGTTEEILDMYIGHFEETQKVYGNIGLAAHNRGYRVNYFNRLKELEIGDEIIYTCFGESKKYIVFQKFIIEDTNWKVLENTQNNQLTLITCMENEPNLRRCVKAVQKND